MTSFVPASDQRFTCVPTAEYEFYEEMTMMLGRFLAAAAITALLGAPVIAQASPPPPSANHSAANAPGTTSQLRAKSDSQKNGGLIDINSASSQELDKLAGVGPARAHAIIANRPYKGKDDLAQRQILPDKVYAKIKDKSRSMNVPVEFTVIDTTARR